MILSEQSEMRVLICFSFVDVWVSENCNGAIDVMAGQIDGLAKNANKCSLSSRHDDPKKIEQLYGKLDIVGLLFGLTDKIGKYLESISNAGVNSNILTP